MFCSNCGNEIDENVKFCPHCGFNFSTNKEAEVPAANDVNINNNPKTNNGGCLSQIFSIIGAFIFISIIFNVFFSDLGGISSTNEGKSSSLEVTESHSCSLGYGARAICGTVVNNSSRNVGYAQVEINLYDKNGNLVGSTMDNINNLEANGTWKFQAAIIEDNVATYKVKNVTGF